MAFKYKEKVLCTDIWCEVKIFSLHFIEKPEPTLNVYTKDGQSKTFVCPSHWIPGNKTAQSRWKKYNELKQLMYSRHNKLFNALTPRQIAR